MSSIGPLPSHVLMSDFKKGLNAADEFLRQFNYPSSGLLGTINAIY